MGLFLGEESIFKDCAWSTVLDSIETVHERFPMNAAARAKVYRYMARELDEIAYDLESDGID